MTLSVLPEQFPDPLGGYMETVKSRKGDLSDMTLAVLHDIRSRPLGRTSRFGGFVP